VEEQEKKVKLNEQELTEQEFKTKKAELEKKPGVVVVETGERKFRTRLKG
jgi:hypothetical protein